MGMKPTTCKNCEHFKRYDSKPKPMCFRYPPVLQVFTGSGVQSARPTVGADDPSCGEFKHADV
jgi:hypothetical protein